MTDTNRKNYTEKTRCLHFSEKGIDFYKRTEEVFAQWLEASEFTREEFLKYRTVKGFHIAENETGLYMAYYDENGEEKMIGVGLYQEQRNAALCIFVYACTFLDTDTNSGAFTKKLIEWGNKNG